ncbi:MAG: hypothetical protein QXH80_02035, partial [Candidatus Nanoarchaeia archaeon]
MNKTALLTIGAIVVLLGVFANLANSATFNVTNPAEFQSALTTAQSNGEDDTINVESGTYNIATTLTYTTSQNFSLTITGAGASTTILDGGGSVQPIFINAAGSSGAISISDITIQNGLASAPGVNARGGGIYINSFYGKITLSNCKIINNISNGFGGGAYILGQNGDITIDNCVIDNNSLNTDTGDDGGGLEIYVEIGGTANITLTNSSITNNSIGECPHSVGEGTPDGAGVAIYCIGTGNTITIRGNTIFNNSTLRGTAGGLLFRSYESCTFVFENNIIQDNKAGNDSSEGAGGGGACCRFNGVDLNFSKNVFIGNQLAGQESCGGGLNLEVNSGANFKLFSNVFSNNTAGTRGGGAQIVIGPEVTNPIIAENLFVGNATNTTDGCVGGGLNLASE